MEKNSEKNEIWKEVDGFPNYKISSMGRVWSKNKNGFLKQNWSGHIRKGKGYMGVQLFNDGKYWSCRVHRLVAEAFIPNPENKPTVNHKNMDITDNSLENLEWATYSEQTVHAIKNGRVGTMTGKFGRFHNKSKPVTNGIKVYESVTATAKDGYSASCVSQCCLGRTPAHRGLQWRFVTKNEAIYE